MSLGEAREFAPNVVRTVKKWFPRKQVILALFADPRLAEWYIDPIRQAPELAALAKADGLLIDTFDKTMGLGLLDYRNLVRIRRFVGACHQRGVEAWVAGSIGREEMPNLWATGVDVICVRGAACQPGSGPGRFGNVCEELVDRLVRTIPGPRPEK